jgi:hypothetical protein
VWQHADTKPVSLFRGKEKEQGRSCFLEKLDIEVYNVDRNNKVCLIHQLWKLWNELNTMLMRTLYDIT